MFIGLNTSLKSLLHLKAIMLSKLPTYLKTWIQEGESCIFTTPQIKTWDAFVLKACPWFFECPLLFNLPKEKLESSEIGSTQDEDTSSGMLDDTEVAPKPAEKNGKRKRGSKVVVIDAHEKTHSAKSKDVEQQTPFSTWDGVYNFNTYPLDGTPLLDQVLLSLSITPKRGLLGIVEGKQSVLHLSCPVKFW